MKLVVFSHKPCWPCSESPTGFATDGGFAFQMCAISELFDETTLLVPSSGLGKLNGEIHLKGKRLNVVPLLPPLGAGMGRKLLFPVWLLASALRITKAFCRADAVHSPIPGDIGTVGMLLAWLFRKPLFVRHCGNWMRPVTLAEQFWRWFMEKNAGGRNVMLATGGSESPPSQLNSNVRWIFSTSLTKSELNRYGCPRHYPVDGELQLIIVARQEVAKGAGTIIRSLPLISPLFPKVSLEVVGDGSALPEFKRLAKEIGVAERVRFPGKLNHEEVMQRLEVSHLFVFPTTSSDGFPKSVHEALASGLPVIATRVSVLPQLLGSGCGALIDSAQPESIAEAVTDVLREAARYEEMSRKAIATAKSYSLENWRSTIGALLVDAWGRTRGMDTRS